MPRRFGWLVVALALPGCEIVAGLAGSRDGPLVGSSAQGGSAGSGGSVMAGGGPAARDAGGGPGGTRTGGSGAGSGHGAGGTAASAASGGSGPEPTAGEAGITQGGAGTSDGGETSSGRGGAGGLTAAGGSAKGGTAGRAGSGGASGGRPAGGSGGEPALSLGGRPALASSSCNVSEPACVADSACTTLPVPGGPFAMGRGGAGSTDEYAGDGVEVPEHPVTVSPFWLDKYEVTVARFRRFVESYDGTPPPAGAGNHPLRAASGWKEEWNDQLPKSRADLESLLLAPDEHCNSSYRTWTKSAGNSECLPINCIDWHVSYAFCIWDGGRLPTEAEWEFAAAGGDQNLLYPWGPEKPDATRAVFGCGMNCTPGDIRPIGSTTSAGYGRYGQADLAGSMLERTRDVMDPDFYGSDPAIGTDVIDLSFDTTLANGAVRGGNYLRDPAGLRAAARDTVYRSSRWDGVGIRCARNP